MLPSGWPGFTATRRFRGATYQIRVAVPDGAGGAGGRVRQLRVNGDLIPGTLVPLAPPGATVTVDGVLGCPDGH
jgi:cellobiose phosphorylase